MNRILVLILLCLIFSGGSAQINPFFISFGDSGMVSNGTGAVVLNSGNLLYAGTEYAPFVDSRIVLKKLDTEGNEIWSTTFSKPGEALALTRIIIDSLQSVVYLAGQTVVNSLMDGIVIKSDTNGTWLDTIIFGNQQANESLNGICLSADGGFAVIGFQSYPGSYSNFYVAKADSAGAIQWQNNFGYQYIDVGVNIVTADNGGYLISGDSQQGLNSYYNVLVLKLDDGGSDEWVLNITSPFNSGCKAMIKDAFGDYVISGETETPTSPDFDILIIKVDSQGNLLWNKSLTGSDKGDAGFSISEFLPGHYLLTGYHYDLPSNNTAQYMAHCDSSGMLLDFRVYNFMPSIDVGYQIIPVNNGFYIAGTSISAINQFTLAYDSLTLITGMDVPEPERLVLYPNPVKAGEPLYVRSLAAGSVIEIRDLLCRPVLRESFSSVRNLIEIPESISKGIYVLQLITADSKLCSKVIIE
ncbi:MAG: T9SS type A sorting domain-containing protein [Bacteroidia bacterium]|nr:T9SS type A sorting domain-containing protein [Bacteroidia bacterium]MCZ2278146.1 T9SS type A sorting domain-containing protein [Bacteroidia bacterium]